MSAISPQFTEQLLMLVLAASAVLAWVLWYRGRKELRHFKQLFDDLPNPILRISLSSFAPVVCNRAFSRLLGYKNNASCIAKFSQHPHLSQQNFYQIYRLSQDSKADASGNIRTDIVLRDRAGNMVHQRLTVQLERTNRFVDIVLDAPRSGLGLEGSKDEREKNEPLVQQNLLAYLKLDLRLNIVAYNTLAKEMFSLTNNKRRLANFESVLPDSESRQLIDIYRRRLTKHGQLTLKIDPDDSEGMGQWILSKDAANDYYHAFFKELDVGRASSGLAHSLQALLGDSLGSVKLGFWEYDHRQGLISHNKAWLNRLGFETDDPGSEPISFWLSNVAPTNREDVSDRFTQGADEFTLHYKMVSSQGVQLDIESRGIVTQRGADGAALFSEGVHIELTRNEQSTLDRKTVHHLMNLLASVSGYADLIEGSGDLPDGIRKYVAQITQAASSIREILSPDNNRKVNKGLSVQKLASQFKLKVRDSATDTLNYSLNGIEPTDFTEAISPDGDHSTAANLGKSDDQSETFIKTEIDDETVEELIKHIVQFIRDETDGDLDIAFLMPEAPATPPYNNHCSSCDAFVGEEFTCLKFMQANVNIEPKHFQYFLQPGFLSSISGDENFLLRASELVRENGGHLDLSLIGRNLNVALYLPLMIPVAIELDVNLASGEIANACDKKILVIDDEQSVANFLKEVIQRAGFSVTAFTDSREALDYFIRHPYQFDLVITDQTMPGYSGDVVMQRMLELNPELPIIMCTGYSDAVSERSARKLGAAGYLTKPVEALHLINTIQQSLEAN
ncbi:MAG: response regulator [Pseudomonadales bacterium]